MTVTIFTPQMMQEQLLTQKQQLESTDLYAELFELLKRRSFQKGDFTLASGQKSSYYLDARLTSLHPQGATLIGQLIWQLIKPFDIDAVGGLTMGADPIVTAVTIASYQNSPDSAVNGFLVRKATKDHGTKKQIEGLSADYQPKRIVIVEDVTTTGGSLWQAYDAVRATYPNAEIPFAVTLVDRRDEATPLTRDSDTVALGNLYPIQQFI